MCENKSLLQSTPSTSKCFVSITEEQCCRQIVENFVNFLNNFPWKFRQQFMFAGDQTKEIAS
jgi:hypothetical protein